LKTIPTGIGADRIGRAGPLAAADLPRIAIALDQVRESVTGVGAVTSVSFDGAQWNTVSGARVSGLLQIHIWAAGAAEITQVVEAVSTFLDSSFGALAAAGFAVFETQAIRPAEGLRLADDSPALHTTLEFSIVYERVATLASGPGGRIAEIDVTIDGQLNETMTVK
jgi:hypothetical protein